MKKIIVLLCCMASLLRAQDWGRIRIQTPLNQPFVASLNGVRSSTVHALQATFDYLEDNSSYQLRIWFPVAQYPINLSVVNTVGYESTYILQKDQIGAYIVSLANKTPLNAVQAPPSNTVTTTPAAPAAVSDADFNTRLASVKKEAGDEGKLKKAKLAFGPVQLKAEQVAKILKAFAFDDTKLDFAKFAYPKTVDKTNYYLVVDAITFSQTKSDLEEFIQKNP